MKKSLQIRLLLFAGVILIVVPFLWEGLAIIPETGKHMLNDLTVDLLPHLLILGAVLILYSFYRMGK